MGIAKPLNPETGVGAPTGYTMKTESMLDGFMQWPEEEWVVTHELAENMWMIGGVGGNMTVLSGPDGVLLVDSGHPAYLDDRVIPAVKELVGDRPVRYIINTEVHGDHVGGNSYFAERGAVIIAADEGRLETIKPYEIVNPAEPGKRYRRSDGQPPSGLPVLTLAPPNSMTLYFNNQTIKIMHAPSGHTATQLVVHFQETNVVATGDVFFHHGYCLNVDGSPYGIIDGQKMVLALCDDKTRIVTGHSIGVVSSLEDLLRDHEVQVTQTEKIAYLIKAGHTLEEIIALKPTAEFDEGTPKGYAWWGLHGDIRVITLYLGITAGKDIP